MSDKDIGLGGAEPARDTGGASPKKKPSLEPELGGKTGYKQDLAKHEGPKAEKGWGNRKPKPVDPTAPKKPLGRQLAVGPVFKWKSNMSGAVASSKAQPDAQDKTFIEGLTGKISDIEVGSMSADLNALKAKVVGFKVGAEGGLAHAELDIVDQIAKSLFGEPKPQPEVPENPTVSMAPMAARVGDITMHGSPLFPGPGSSNVCIGGLPAWRCTIDLAMCPFPGAAPHGTGPSLSGEATVLINGFPAARVGDFVVEPSGGPNVIALGCPTVMIGTPTPPPPPKPPKSAGPPEPPWVVFGAKATGDVGRGEVKGSAEADIDAKAGKGKIEIVGGAEFAMFKGSLPLNIKIRVPGTQAYLGLGVTLEGSALTLGAEGGLGGAINENGKFIRGTAGANIGAGLFGGGVKFSVDIGK